MFPGTSQRRHTLSQSAPNRFLAYSKAIGGLGLAVVGLSANLIITPVGTSLALEPTTRNTYGDHTESSRERANAHNAKGIRLYKARNYRAAVSEFTVAMRLNPTLSGILYNRGNAFFRLRQFEAALDDYVEALRLNPRFVMAMANRGNALSALGRLDEALDAYNAAAKLEPKNTYVLFNRAYVYGKRGEYPKAIADFTVVLAQNPDDVDALVLRATAYKALGDLQSAQEDYEKARSLDPWNARLRANPNYVDPDGRSFKNYLRH